MKLDRFLTPCTKLNSKWTKHLNVRLKTVKILEESTGINLSHISHSDIFLDISPEARETKAKKILGDYIKIKSFCIAKESNQQDKKDNLLNGRRYLQMTF